MKWPLSVHVVCRYWKLVVVFAHPFVFSHKNVVLAYKMQLISVGVRIVQYLGP